MKYAGIPRKLRLIATLARDTVEAVAKKPGEVFEKGVGFYTYASSPDLAGWCSVASQFLAEIATQQGFKVTFVKGLFGDQGDHCWITYGRYIIDITATQFRIPHRVRLATRKHSDYKPLLIDSAAVKAVQGWNPGDLEYALLRPKFIRAMEKGQRKWAPY